MYMLILYLSFLIPLILLLSLGTMTSFHSFAFSSSVSFVGKQLKSSPVKRKIEI